MDDIGSRLRLLLVAVLLAAGAAAPAAALADDGETPVDVELVLAVDVSWSMDLGEQRIQREGYAAAFRSPDVQRAILEGGYGKVAVTYVEWAGALSQSVVVPWTLIDSKGAADAFAERLEREQSGRFRRTSIAAAIDFAAPLFDGNGLSGLRRVIDVSGDGPNNQGRMVTDARDAAAAKGITVNGLPLMTSGASGGFSSWGSIPDLDRYYETCVIGGPGAFMIPVNDWVQFPEAVRRKLVLELAGGWPAPHGPARPVVLAQQPAGGSDCLVGERQWEERRNGWTGDR